MNQEMSLKNIVLTGVTDVMVVNIEAGLERRITNRSSYGLSFCTSGKLVYEHDGKQFISDNTHVLVLPQGCTYMIHGIEPGLFPVINFTCIEKNSIAEFLSYEVDSIGGFMHSYAYLQKLFLFKRETYHAKSLSIVYDMIGNLVIDRKNKTEYDTILPGIRYMEEHYSDPMLSIEQLAEESEISVAYFRRLFEIVYGMSPRKYLMDVRIKQAKQLLSVNRPLIQDIAEKCGFGSVYHFCRCFKEMTGYTATEYYKRFGGKGI